MRKRVLSAVPSETNRRASGWIRVAIIEGVDELFAADAGWLWHHAILQTRRSQLVGSVTNIE